MSSRAVALGVFVWLLSRVLPVPMAPRDYVTLSAEYLRKILRVGIPSAIEQLTYQARQAVFLDYVTFLGPVALASRQYAHSISQYVFLCSLAIGLGTSILVGRHVGARRVEDAYREALAGLGWALGVTFVLDVVIILLRERLVGLFTNDGGILQVASRVIVIGFALETGRAFNLVLVNALRAAGDAPFSGAGRPSPGKRGGSKNGQVNPPEAILAPSHGRPARSGAPGGHTWLS